MYRQPKLASTTIFFIGNVNQSHGGPSTSIQPIRCQQEESKAEWSKNIVSTYLYKKFCQVPDILQSGIDRFPFSIQEKQVRIWICHNSI